LLDLRLVKNFAGESSRAVLLASSAGRALVAPPLTLTPMLSVAVRTTAGAFARQLPVPLSHRRPLGVVGVVGVVGVLVVLWAPLLVPGDSGVVLRGLMVERPCWSRVGTGSAHVSITSLSVMTHVTRVGSALATAAHRHPPRNTQG
jgi:hypothetical protein